MLGRATEAEDVLQEAYLRWQSAPREDVDFAPAFLTSVVVRLSIDVLRSARVRRESYVGPWLPEPVLDPLPGPADPADRVTLDESVGFALLVVLETLSPAERTAWVLHDLFGLPFVEVAAAVGRTPQAVRQLRR